MLDDDDVLTCIEGMKTYLESLDRGVPEKGEDVVGLKSLLLYAWKYEYVPVESRKMRNLRPEDYERITARWGEIK